MALTPGFRAIVIDDDELCREVTGAILTELGAASVAKLQDGNDALAWADASGVQLDLVVCDLRMPQVDGIETLAGLASRTRSATVVIASSADPRLLRAAAQMVSLAGIQHVQTVSKPVTVEKLEAALALGAASGEGRWAQWEAHTFQPPDCSTNIIRGMAMGDFVPFFRPKVSPGHNALRSVEAHFRWMHPTYGVLTPESFLGVAETTGLLPDLFYSMMTQVAVFLGECRERGQHVRADLQVPLSLLASAELPRRLESFAAGFALTPGQFGIEVPQELWTGGGRELQEILTRLRVREFGLVASGCGTRMSGLEQFESAPFDEIALAEHVIASAAASSDERDALRDFIASAKALGLRVVATGVNTAAQQQCAAEAGCSAIQGKAVAPPLPAREFERWALEQLELLAA